MEKSKDIKIRGEIREFQGNLFIPMFHTPTDEQLRENGYDLGDEVLIVFINLPKKIK